MISLLWKAINYFVFLHPLYMSFIWIAGGLLFYFRWERKKVALPAPEDCPLFSIIIPAHNEEGTIEDALADLAQINYPRYEAIVVNDGSTDRTGRILDELLKKYGAWLRVIHLRPNSGKAKAVNTGILVSKGQFILVMDADSFLDRNALSYMAYHFLNYPRVGAVTGNPRVANRTTLLGKIQVGEYSSIIGLIKRSQRLLGKILTVSGVIAAFRKSALCDCGLFDTDTVTEDIDVTWKLQEKFWDIRYEPRAICWVLVPETIKGLWRQRVRWSQGGIEVIKKHAGVWTDLRQRRLWPVYIEYIMSALWAHVVFLLIGIWLVMYGLHSFNPDLFAAPEPALPLIPRWSGAVLALLCLIQVVVSLFIDFKYESRASLKYYFWAIWYPFFYWFISALSVLVGVYNVFIRRTRGTVTWKSPDRGLHTLKS
jgi:biofilm PGA synthesis N-glycosyltransferase PgaC